MAKSKQLPKTCPACEEQLHVERLTCQRCDTSVEGSFSLPVLARLSTEDHDFLLRFFKSSGSLKEMAKQTGHSYPKVRNTLDDIIKEIKRLEPQKTH